MSTFIVTIDDDDFSGTPQGIAEDLEELISEDYPSASVVLSPQPFPTQETQTKPKH